MRTKRFLIIFGILIFSWCVSAITGEDSFAAKKKTSSITLEYDGQTHTYSDVQGMLNYNHKDIALTTMPVVKIDEVLYAPAQELLQTVFGYTFTYDESSLTYTAEDQDVSIRVVFRAGDTSYKIVRGGQETEISNSVPIRMIGKDSADAVVCIPITKLLTGLGYTASWEKSKACYTIQKTDFFNWSVNPPEPDGATNHVIQATAGYSMIDLMAILSVNLKGDLQSSFDGVTVDRKDNVITISLPKSAFLPERKTYERFGEIVDKMEITETDGTVTITFTCPQTTEFAYTVGENSLNLKILWDYSNTTGKISNHSLTIKRPNNCYSDKVSCVDMYDSVKYQKAFKIILKGDHKAFFREHPVVINNNSVKKVKIYLSDAGNTVIKVTTRSLQGFKVTRVGENFVVQMNKPKKIYKNIIVLDAGHGGHDNGTVNYGYHEKNLNLKMIYTFMKSYFNQIDPEIKVYWTRKSDHFVTLENRSKFAAKVGADAFISLHMNAASNKKANGTEVYYSSDNNKKGFGGIHSSDMAEDMDDALVDELGMADRGVKKAGFYVIKRNSVPAILIELGFLSGSKDHLKLTDRTFQKKASKTIAEVIKTYFKDYSTGR